MSKIEFTNKEAFNFAIAFIKGNWVLALVTTLIFTVLILLSYMPFPIGTLFSITYVVFSTSVQIYVARVAKESYFIEDVENKASNTNFSDFFLKYLQTALGFSAGIFLFTLIFVILLGIILNILFPSLPDKISLENLSNIPSQTLLLSSLIVLSLLSWFTYVGPAVSGKVFLAESFQEAFFKTFNIINPNFWAKTLSKRYFNYIVIWSFIVFALIIVMSLMLTSLIFIPIGLLILYFITLYNAIVFIYTDEKLK
jgi:hypothetical protein